MSRQFSRFSILATLLLFTSSALAVPFTSIRIGDIDGMGFTPTAGLLAASGAAADTNANNLLEAGEFLPDLNGDGIVATFSGDDFDNRSGAEIAGTLLGGSGYTDAGSMGSQWTDISLSTSFSGPNFPDPGGPGTPNNANFLFDFFVANGDIVPGSQIFLNVIFGDYDVFPAQVNVTLSDSTSFTIPLMLQAGGADGLIQAATATLSFADVFDIVAGGFDGFLDVDFIGPNEPYLAFDFAELSLIPLVPMSEPGMLVLFGLGLIGFGLARRKN